MELDTVKIVHPKTAGKYRIINAIDYDPSVHTLFGSEPVAEPAPEPAPTPEPEPVAEPAPVAKKAPAKKAPTRKPAAKKAPAKPKSGE